MIQKERGLSKSPTERHGFLKLLACTLLPRRAEVGLFLHQRWLDTTKARRSTPAMTRKIQQPCCSAAPSHARHSCGSVSPSDAATHGPPEGFHERVCDALRATGSNLGSQSLTRFVNQLDKCIQHRRIWLRKRQGHLPPDDIISLIQDAAQAGDLDEAFWRAFIAGHFGRTSANPNKPAQVMSAARLLFGFGSVPYWTWERFRAQPVSFMKWLDEQRLALRNLSFGNHRKFESKRPRKLWAVFKSFYDLVQKHGDGPSALFDCGSEKAPTPAARFQEFDTRLKSVERFGRTARFDLLTLLRDVGLIDAEPDSCYLRGSTGPLKGARRVWGRRSVRELDHVASEFSRRIGVPPQVVEDALCAWQKN